eukprot:4944993-Lingulodinium_polyedra.AAC.1
MKICTQQETRETKSAGVERPKMTCCRVSRARAAVRMAGAETRPRAPSISAPMAILCLTAR